MKRWRAVLILVVLGRFPSGLRAQDFWQDLEEMWYLGKVYQGQLMEARSSVTSGVGSYSRSLYVSTRLPGNHYGRYEIVKGGLKINFGNSCQGFNITADIFGKVDVDELVSWVTDLSMNTLYAMLLSYVYSVPGVANAQTWLNKYRELTLTPVISRCNTKRILDVFQKVGPSAPLDPIQRTCITAYLTAKSGATYSEAEKKCKDAVGSIYSGDTSGVKGAIGQSFPDVSDFARSLIKSSPRSCWDKLYDSMSDQERNVIRALLGGQMITRQGGELEVEDVDPDSMISYQEIYDSVMEWTKQRMDDLFDRMNNDFSLLNDGNFRSELFGLFTPDAVLSMDDILDALYVFSNRSVGGTSFDTSNKDYQSFRDAVAELNAMYAIRHFDGLVLRYMRGCGMGPRPSDWDRLEERFAFLREEFKRLWDYDNLYRARSYIRNLLVDISMQKAVLAADVKGGVSPEALSGQ